MHTHTSGPAAQFSLRFLFATIGAMGVLFAIGRLYLPLLTLRHSMSVADHGFGVLIFLLLLSWHMSIVAQVFCMIWARWQLGQVSESESPTYHRMYRATYRYWLHSQIVPLAYWIVVMVATGLETRSLDGAEPNRWKGTYRCRNHNGLMPITGTDVAKRHDHVGPISTAGTSSQVLRGESVRDAAFAVADVSFDHLQFPVSTRLHDSCDVGGVDILTFQPRRGENQLGPAYPARASVAAGGVIIVTYA